MFLLRSHPDASDPTARADRRAAHRAPAHRRAFWREAAALRGSVTPFVLPRVLASGAMALAVCAVVRVAERWLGLDLTLDVAPHELAGAVLGLLLVLRTNAGYDRWWEARKLWGGIVNQSRNFAIGALAYGPDDPAWRDRVVRWTAAFGHASRASLRGQPLPPEVAALVGAEGAARLAAADHPPSAVALTLARLLRGAGVGMDRFAFQQVDTERAALLDHLGGCERIVKTPLPVVYAIKVRRFIVLYLLTLPLALLPELDRVWLVPIITMMLAYPLFSLDQIGVELQNPFAEEHLSHLPLTDICATIERNVLALPALGPELDVGHPAPAGPRERERRMLPRDGQAPGWARRVGVGG